jgi:hypothetical protein
MSQLLLNMCQATTPFKAKDFEPQTGSARGARNTTRDGGMATHTVLMPGSTDGHSSMELGEAFRSWQDHGYDGLFDDEVLDTGEVGSE